LIRIRAHERLELAGHVLAAPGQRYELFSTHPVRALAQIGGLLPKLGSTGAEVVGGGSHMVTTLGARMGCKASRTARAAQTPAPGRRRPNPRQAPQGSVTKPARVDILL